MKQDDHDNRRFRSRLVGLFIFVLAVSAPAAAETLIIDSEEQFRFAEEYFFNRNYSSAVTEYQRYIHFFPKGDRVEQAMYKIGLSYFHSDRFSAAINAFMSVLKKYKETETALKSQLWISECNVRQKEFDLAILNLQDLVNKTTHQGLRDEAYYRMGWVYVEMARWDSARETFGRISPENDDRYRLRAIRADLDKSGSIKKKDPELAGFLSILPGAGQAYCGRYHDALTAFLLNAGLAYAAFESFDQGLNALGGVITFVELGFYAGNIYGAVNSAHKYNKSGTQSYIEGIKRRTKIVLSAKPGTEPGIRNMMISIVCRF